QYTEALSIMEQQADYRLVLTALRRLGDFLWMTDEDAKAVAYFDRALSLAKQQHDTTYLVRLYVSLGNLSSKTKYYQKAESYLDSALSFPQYLSDRQKSAIYNSLGIVNYDLANFEISAGYYSRSMTLKENLNDSVGMANTWMNLGNTYEAMGKPALSTEALRKSYSLADRLNLPYLKRTVLLNLSRIYENSGDYEKALYYDNLYDSINQSLFDKEKASQLDEIREQFDADKREAKILLLQQNEEIQTKLSYSRLQQRNYLIGATLLLLAVLVLIYIAYSQKRSANRLLQKQNAIITEREKEKELLLHEVNHRVKNNLQMIGGLLRLQSHNLADSEAAAAVKEGQARVEALTLIHKKIFENSDHTKIHAPEYFKELVDNLVLSSGVRIRLDLDLEAIELDVDQVVPLALIVNELITNAIKYAFTNQDDGLLVFSLKKKNTREIALSVKDNGRQGVDPKTIEQSRSFGINLVNTLAAQLKGNLLLDNSAGTHWQLIFPQLHKI
ncbi:MAG: tetratricopeptide repeat protein, partial [Cyclobacteriaceae bacterium]